MSNKDDTEMHRLGTRPPDTCGSRKGRRWESKDGGQGPNPTESRLGRTPWCGMDEVTFLLVVQFHARFTNYSRKIARFTYYLRFK
jgi:hypothetical protein